MLLYHDDEFAITIDRIYWRFKTIEPKHPIKAVYIVNEFVVSITKCEFIAVFRKNGAFLWLVHHGTHEIYCDFLERLIFRYRGSNERYVCFEIFCDICDRVIMSQQSLHPMVKKICKPIEQKGMFRIVPHGFVDIVLGG